MSAIKGYRKYAGVDSNNFSQKSDAEIVAGARAVLEETPKENLRGAAKKILSPRFKLTEENLRAAGTILWSALCGWKRTWILPTKQNPQP